MKDIRQKLLATFQVEHRDHVEQIRSLLAMIEKTAAQPAGPELEEAFRRAHSLKGAARAVDLHPVEGLAHRLETLFSRVRQGVLLLDREVAAVVEQALDASEDCVTALGESRAAPGFTSAFQALERVLGIKSEAPGAGEPDTQTTVPAFQPLETVRITAQNFDGLLQSAGRLLSESYRQNQLTEQQRSSRTMQQLCKQLQMDVWRARMVPAESLLEGYRKMMRDLARDEAKEIEFRATSTGVQADRGVLDALKDPLMHLLRNAVSHGIESPKERAANGKSPAGLVTLRVETKGQHLTIAIEDDGRGVDLARVAEVAVRERILSEAEASVRSPRELTRILFRPGFSTSRSLTNLSGRGMGLSVVHEAVRRLRGEVDLQPRNGGGTTMHLSVPLSLAAHRLLLVSWGGQSFAVPIHAIERLYRIDVKSVQTVDNKPVILLEGQPVPLLSLGHLLNLAPASAEELRVMILRSGDKRVAVTVDAFLWETDSVIQDLGPAGPRDRKISGGILLEDGTVAFVLNPVELMEAPAHRSWPSVFKPSEPAHEKPAASILVVDDSLTTRTLEKSILEAHGYRVRVAVDGLEALDQLRAEKADLVIADIQMPRLDGFGLLEAMKKDDHLNRIPVIVVTSLEQRKDQERGLALGADAYIVKRKFDQGELLAAIRQIL